VVGTDTRTDVAVIKTPPTSADGEAGRPTRLRVGEAVAAIARIRLRELVTRALFRKGRSLPARIIALHQTDVRSIRATRGRAVQHEGEVVGINSQITAAAAATRGVVRDPIDVAMKLGPAEKRWQGVACWLGCDPEVTADLASRSASISRAVRCGRFRKTVGAQGGLQASDVIRLQRQDGGCFQ